MKSQIISKLAQQPQPLTHSLLLNKPTHNHNNSNHEYYHYHASPTQHNKKQCKVKDFFQKFESNCIISYSKVNLNKPLDNKRLQETLVQLRDKAQISNVVRSDHLFSFKKQENAEKLTLNKAIAQNNKENKQNKQNTYNRQNKQNRESSNKRTHYFIASKPKIKLRKFHSLASLKTQQSSKDDKSNCKMGYSQVQYTTSRASICTASRHLRDSSRDGSFVQRQLCDDYGNQCEKMGVGVEEKGRLARIRKELNQIYQMKKEPVQLKLRLV